MLELLRSLLQLPPVGPLQATAAAVIGAYAGFLAASVQRGFAADLPPLLLQSLGTGAHIHCILPQHSAATHPGISKGKRGSLHEAC